MPDNIDLVSIKEQVDMVALVGHWLSLKRTGTCHKGLCPFHPDVHTPSLVVYVDHAYCYGRCQRSWDCFSFLQDILSISFYEAVQWLRDHLGELPRRIQHTRTADAPLAPIPPDVLDYWTSLLNDDVRAYYHSRMLTDSTIAFYRLGYDGRAYVIPLWEEHPNTVEVYGIHYRRAGTGNGPKYWSMPNRGQPRLFNRWLLEDAHEAIVVIGEFDAILGWQDGLCMVSPTAGQLAWLSEWTKWFASVERVFVVPDKGEEAAGYSIASRFLGRAKVCAFPDGIKDYTEMRQNGYSAADFRRMVLEV